MALAIVIIAAMVYCNQTSSCYKVYDIKVTLGANYYQSETTSVSHNITMFSKVSVTKAFRV